MISEFSLPKKPSAKLDENIKLFDELLGVKISWDIIHKEFDFSGKRMQCYCINGFFLTLNLVVVLENIADVIQEYISDAEKFDVVQLKTYLNTRVAFVQVSSSSDMQEILRFALSGPIVLFFDGLDEAIIVDTRIYPMRNTSEPEVERVIRGPKDGFTETMLINTSLIRRRIRDPKLRAELYQVGVRSKTDVSLMYIEDITNPGLLKEIRRRIKSIDLDGIPMAEGAVSDYLMDTKTGWSIYPSVRLTERPDVAATSLLEGQAVLIIDTTPEAIILPCVFLQHLHHPEDYHLTPFAGSYLRWALLVSMIASVWISPLWLALNGISTRLPVWLRFIHPGNESQIPLTVQLLVLEFGIDIFRRAVINTPVPLASAIGIVSGIVFGQLAVTAKLFDTDVLVFSAASAIAQYATASLELAGANRVARVFLILLTGIFGLWSMSWLGFLIGSAILFIGLLRKRVFGIPYLWPLIPWNWKALQCILLRVPANKKGNRPSIFHPIDADRTPRFPRRRQKI